MRGDGGRRFEKGNKAAKGGARPGAGRKPDAVKITVAAFYESCSPLAMENITRILKDPKHPEHTDISKWAMEGWGGKHVQRMEVSNPGATLQDPLDKENMRAMAALGKEA
jgi:hypothetical protein